MGFNFVLHFAYSVVCLICNKTKDYAQQCSSMSAIYDLTIKQNKLVLKFSIPHESRSNDVGHV